ncbi:MAG: hypothetical protein JXL20_11020 [Deltaproteobacteria bacterium]|nr:hypothetical protein [Deltaproteobacteria bacterium]
MKTKNVIPTILVGLLVFLAAGAGAAEFKLRSPNDVTLHNVTAQAETYQGRDALKIELTDEIQRQILKGQGSNFPAFAILPADFKNGIIEVDIAGELNGKGTPSARAFVGVAFHIPADRSTYEAVYLRMKNGRLTQPTPPEPIISRAIQYTAHPDFHWPVSRKEFPGKYEKGANIAPGMWIHLRLEISGSELKAFINDEKEPALTVGDLRFGNSTGKIGLWVDDGTAAYFSNLRIRQK